MTLKSAQRSVLVDQVIVQLRAQIASGEWPVGSRIPTEPELAEMLGVGRNTVREGVRALAHAGLLEIRQGAGTFVRAASELAGAVRRRVASADIREATEVRRALEVEAARQAARRRTPEDLATIDAALREREEHWASGDADAFVASDARLHQLIIAAAHNSLLADLYADIGEAVLATLRETVGETLREEGYVDHSRLVAAIHARDTDAAMREASVYLDAILDRLDTP